MLSSLVSRVSGKHQSGVLVQDPSHVGSALDDSVVNDDFVIVDIVATKEQVCMGSLHC